MADVSSDKKILIIDIGGSRVKATVLNNKGDVINEYTKVDTPAPASPQNIIGAIKELVKNFPAYDNISVGFPGYIKEGVVKTAPNLGTELWKDTDLATLLQQTFSKPARVVNDADLQGLGLVSGKGLEMVITLGTGFGTAVLYNGKLLPHLELAHHPITKEKTYDEYIGNIAFEKEGAYKWNERLQRIISILKTVFNYDRLYISGGNAKKIKFALDENITVDGNKDGIKGGIKLWADR